MVAAVASRSRPVGSASKDSQPPAKKTKLSQPTSTPRPNGFKALLNGSTGKQASLKAKINGHKHGRKSKVDEATTVIGGGLGGHGDVDMDDAGKEVIEISSAEEESDYSSEHEEQEDNGRGKAAKASSPEDVSMTNGITNGNIDDDADEGEAAAEGTAEPEEMSFGERLQAQEPAAVPNVVDVEAFVGPTPESRALATASNNRPLSAPSATSLGTVLTQALRTNDSDLLESCFRVIDVDTIYATIERLPSYLVGNLLQKLAERLHKRPGRAGMLMIWVQWSLAAHGGYLASQPQVVKQLANLNKVLKERASGLQPLLSLKGRLDMLHAQLELRRRNQKRATQDEEDEAVIYVEGEDDYSSDEADDAQDGDILTRPTPKSKKPRRRKEIEVEMEEDDDSEDDDMPMTFDQEGESDDEDEEDSEDMIDDEAEETEDDTGDDMSEVESDESEEECEDISESEEEARPARRSTAARSRR